MNSSFTTRTRRTRRVALPLFATATAAALVLAGCSGSSDADTGDKAAAKLPTGQNIVVSFISPAPAEQPAMDYLKATFETQFPGNTLTFANTTWPTRTDDYEKSVVKGEGTVPDVIELGNTDVPTYSSQGVLTDITGKFDDLGGADLLKGLVQSGTYDGKFYAAPFYAGARVVWYDSKDVTLTNPATLGDLVHNGTALRKVDYAGLFLPGRDWHDDIAFVYTNGGYIAQQQDDGSWKAGFSTADSIRGLKQFQQAFQEANNDTVAPANTDETTNADLGEVPANRYQFCAGKVGYLPGDVSLGPAMQTSVETLKKTNAEDIAKDPKYVDSVCPNGHAKEVKAFAMPGLTPGTVAKTFAGGSNFAIPAKSEHQQLAYEALKIMTSQGFQDLLAVQAMIPGRISSSVHLPQDATSLEAAKSALEAVSTPAAPNWRDVEDSKVLDDAFQKIAKGGDVTKIAADLDAQIEKILNAPTKADG
ncbi:extracellular solute-binding protein [Luteimicrobium subarcticum]|uniref:N,N'-diacetylchitobiose transport system substrate-binding protein n=1 Tax=Luteimicrobium subarcticum TaxID=620910 RepID=A0A2M8WUC1_9MICO|nr:extracellular solute-binding protein [Luteimicrobium subarcticum]PJI94532.1 N,N'-diacetylchitobiose transport system substrate-binding protein [Luteimicrobium subarcticum]